MAELGRRILSSVLCNIVKLKPDVYLCSHSRKQRFFVVEGHKHTHTHSKTHTPTLIYLVSDIFYVCTFTFYFCYFFIFRSFLRIYNGVILNVCVLFVLSLNYIVFFRNKVSKKLVKKYCRIKCIVLSFLVD